MVLGNDILAYTGNVALGLNSDGLAEYGQVDTKDLNNTLFNLAYLNMQKNKVIYDQKIKDRDDAMKLISNGQLALKNALPKDREILQKKIADVKDIYFKHGGDIKSDPNVWLDINDKLADFQTANTIAQSRLNEYNRGVTEASEETNPVKKQAMMGHWAKQLKEKDIYTPFDPYQHTLDYDIKKTLPGAVYKTSQKREGDYDVTETTTDVDKTFDDYVMAYLTNDKGETQPNIDAHYDDFFGQNGTHTPDKVAEDVATLNDKLRKIAIMEGYDVTGKYKEGDNFVGPLPDGVKPLPKKLQPIKISIGNNGEIGVSDRKDIAMAKLNLALNYKRGQEKVVNPKYAQIDKTKAEIRKVDADTDASRALASERRSVIPLNKAKARYWDRKGTVVENSNKVTNVFNDVVGAAKRIDETQPDGSKVPKDIVWVGDIPPGFAQVLGGVDNDGKPIKLKGKKYANGAEYYEIGKAPYLLSSTGVKYTDFAVRDAFSKQSKFTTLEAFRKHLIEERNFKEEEETTLVGANGISTAESTIQALRALNNKNVNGKGDETLFTGDEEQ